jgi:hypothetical protein
VFGCFGANLYTHLVCLWVNKYVCSHEIWFVPYPVVVELVTECTPVASYFKATVFTYYLEAPGYASSSLMIS